MKNVFHRAATFALMALLLPSPLCAAPRADRIIVHKQARTMELMHAGQVIKTYKIALGGEPVGPKTRQGDHRTPEGTYVIDSRNVHSQFHRSLHISYPMQTIASTHGGWEHRQVVTYISTVCRMAMGSSAPRIVRATGLMAASRSLIRKSKKFGDWWKMERRWTSGPSPAHVLCLGSSPSVDQPEGDRVLPILRDRSLRTG